MKGIPQNSVLEVHRGDLFEEEHLSRRGEGACPALCIRYRRRQENRVRISRIENETRGIPLRVRWIVEPVLPHYAEGSPRLSAEIGEYGFLRRGKECEIFIRPVPFDPHRQSTLEHVSSALVFNALIELFERDTHSTRNTKLRLLGSPSLSARRVRSCNTTDSASVAPSV